MRFSNKLIKRSSLTVLLSMLGGAARADFLVPASVTNNHHSLSLACDRQAETLSLDLERATAALLWTAFCRPDIVRNKHTHEGMFTFGPNGVTDSLGNAVSKDELIISYLMYFAPSMNYEVSTLESSFPLDVKEIPLLTYTTSEGIMAWTGFPTKMPIGELLNEESARAGFCASSAQAPAEFDPAFSLCGIEQVGSANWVRLPSIPPVPQIAGADTDVLAECHDRRISAARSGEITHEELFDLTRENSVPIFNVESDPSSRAIGFEPCVLKYGSLHDARQEAMLDALYSIDSVTVRSRGKYLSLGTLQGDKPSKKGLSGTSQTQKAW